MATVAPMVTYPETPTGDVVDDHHGTKVADPYRWLEDVDAPETRRWIAAQNALTQSWLDGVASRPVIRERLAQLWDHPRRGTPWRRGERWFQLRNSGLQDQDVLWVMDAPDAEGRILLDPNELSSDGTVALSAAAVSHDGRLLAYATSAAGSDWMTWRVRDVDSGADLPDVVEWAKFAGAAWTRDGSGFYYGRFAAPEPGQAHQATNLRHRLCFHRLGTAQDDDELVYARPDEPEWGFHPVVTEDGRWLVVTVSQGTDPRTRLYVADLDSDRPEVQPLIDDFDAAYELVGSDGATWYLRTDLDAPRGRVIAVDVDDPRRERWREVIAESDDTLEAVRLVGLGTPAGGRLVTVHLRDAASRLAVHRLDGSLDHEVDLPGLGSVGVVSGRHTDSAVFFSFERFTAPPAIYRHDVTTARTAPVSPPGLDVDQADFVTEQAFATSDDGTRVPLFLVRRRDVTPDGDRPTLLYGYGGFQIPLTPAFKVAWHVWVERGGVLAVANLRGGGEYGQEWHDAGRLANKQNVFDDFAACARHLVDSGWTAPQRLAIQGGSNGGLLVGASITQHPELFGAAVSEVGVLDMLRFHHFTIGWAWTSDYGSADDPEQFRWLHAYSPLHNLRPGTAYPATLLTTGDHDDRVVPGHSFKFAAALQAAQGGDAPVLLRVETDAGHGAGKPTSKSIDERADVLAFLTRALGADG